MILSYNFDISASVDKTITNKFLPEHLESMKSLINLKAYPTLYGDNFKTIYFAGFKIIDANKVNLDTKQQHKTGVATQIARKGGGINNLEERYLDTSLTTNGVLLSLPPGAVYERTPNDYDYITGMSRDGRYVKYNFSNRLVAVYKAKEGFTADQINDELSQLGNIFNPKQLPQVEAKEHDIIDEGIRGVKSKWCKAEYSDIKNRISPQCEAVSIGDTRQSHIAMVILNSVSTTPVLPMTSEKAKTWLENSKYKNIPDKVRYHVVSYDFVTKGQVDTVKLAYKNPNEEIRVIVHCGIITGGLEQYTARLTKFWVDPQVTEEFDTKQTCLFVQDHVDGEFTQKLDGKLVTWNQASVNPQKVAA